MAKENLRLGGNSTQQYQGNKHTGNNSNGHKHDNCDHKNKNCTEIVYFPYTTDEAKENKYELTQYINNVVSAYTEVLAEYDSKKDELNTAYSYGLERLTYETKKTEYYMYDGRGSVADIVDSKGKVVVSYIYDAYGQETVSKKTDNRYGYNAEYTDSNTGLQYLRARYYNSELGNFTSKDTYAGDIYNPTTLNRYTYAGNNPINNIDPSGHFFKELWEYTKATVKTVGDIGTGIWNIMTDKTPSNLITQTMNTITKVSNNYQEANQNIQNSKNTNNIGTVNTSTNTNKRNIVVTQNVPKPSNNTSNIASYRTTSYGAAVNPTVEKSREIENQIKLLRKQNTAEANNLANYLQENMKKLCEISAPKIQIATGDIKMYSSLAQMTSQEMHEQQQQYYKENQEATLSGVIGMGTSIIGGFVGLLGGTTWGVVKDIKGENSFGFAYDYFNEQYVNPTLQSIRESVPNKDSFDVGYVAGIIIPVGNGILKILDASGDISTAGRVIQVTDGVASAGVVLDSSSAMSLINSFVQASIGAGSSSTSSNNNPSNNDIDTNKINHIFEKEEHKLGDLLKSYDGDQSKVYQVVKDAAQKYITDNKITGIIDANNQITVNVSGFDITVRGNVIDGIFKMGTMFIQ